MADRAAGLPADALPVATPEAVTRTDAIDAIVRVLEVNRPVHWRLIAADVYDAVRPVIAAEAARQERQRIRELADEHDAHYHRCKLPCSSDDHDHNAHPFADLLGGDAP